MAGKASRTVWIMGLSLSCAALIGQTSGQNALDPDREPRLLQKVSLREPAITLQSLMRQLSRETGLDLRAGMTAGQFRVCLFVHEQPLHELLSHLATTLGFEWTRGERQDGRLYYLLGEPARARTEREQLTRFVRLLEEKEPVDLIQEALALVPPAAFKLSREAHQRIIKNPDSAADSRLKALLKPNTPPQTGNLQALYQSTLIDVAQQIVRNYELLHVLRALDSGQWQTLRQKRSLELPLSYLPDGYQHLIAREKELYQSAGIEISERCLMLRVGELLTLGIAAVQLRDGHEAGRLEFAIGVPPIGPLNPQSLVEQFMRAHTVRTFNPALLKRPKAPLEPPDFERLAHWVHLPAELLVRYAEVSNLNLVAEWNAPWFGLFASNESLSSWEKLLNICEQIYKVEIDGSWRLLRFARPAFVRAMDVNEATLNLLNTPYLLSLSAASKLAMELNSLQIRGLDRLRECWRTTFAARLNRVDMTDPYGYFEYSFTDALGDSLTELTSRPTRQLLRFYASLTPAQKATLQRYGRLEQPLLTPAQMGFIASRTGFTGEPQSVAFQLEPTTLPLAVRMLKQERSGFASAIYFFKEPVVKGLKIPTAGGCRFVFEVYPSGLDQPLTREEVLRFALP